MAKKIGQVRYYGMINTAVGQGVASPMNYPKQITTYSKMRGGNNYDIFPRGIV